MLKLREWCEREKKRVLASSCSRARGTRFVVSATAIATATATAAHPHPGHPYGSRSKPRYEVDYYLTLHVPYLVLLLVLRTSYSLPQFRFAPPHSASPALFSPPISRGTLPRKARPHRKSPCRLYDSIDTTRFAGIPACSRENVRLALAKWSVRGELCMDAWPQTFKSRATRATLLTRNIIRRFSNQKPDDLDQHGVDRRQRAVGAICSKAEHPLTRSSASHTTIFPSLAPLPTMCASRRRCADPAAVADRAKSRGWVSGQHTERDKERGVNLYGPKVLALQESVLDIYAM